eukprot:GHUV01037211.1.p1 GENE.GHUV01037211.1~~GHUV01037211.1.p1  ORF type:complete len:250 (+),score=60.86 GHUV01037211.1:258-1007(+)
MACLRPNPGLVYPNGTTSATRVPLASSSAVSHHKHHRRIPAAQAAQAMPLALDWRRPYSPGPLTEHEFNQYWEDGFVIKRGLLSKQHDIEPCLRAIEDIVEGVASKLASAGLIQEPCKQLDVFHRLPALEQQFPEASVLVHKHGTLPRAFADVWSHHQLLAIAVQLLGPAVAGHPTWNLRAATPRQAAAVVPWHQDNAYTGRDCWRTLQVTAWVPLMDVNTTTGCLQLLRGGHRAGATVRHTAAVGDTW